MGKKKIVSALLLIFLSLNFLPQIVKSEAAERDPNNNFTDPDRQNFMKSISINNSDEIEYQISIPLNIYYKGVAEINAFIQNATRIYFYWEIWAYYGENSSVNNHETTSIYNLKGGDNRINFDFNPSFLTIPGEYSFLLYIFLFKTNNSLYEITYAKINFNILLGPLFLICLAIAFLVGLIYIMIQKEVLTTIPFLKNNLHQRISIYLQKKRIAKLKRENPGEDISNYLTIQCPDCRKKIVEGSAFCPWCGYHLRKFERYLVIRPL
jgi:hypothetical protein